MIRRWLRGTAALALLALPLLGCEPKKMIVAVEGFGPELEGLWLWRLSEELLGRRQDLESMTREAKRHVVEHVLPAELHRLLRLVGRALPSVDQGAAQGALEALLVGMDRYRVYVRPDEPVQPADAAALRHAAARGLAWIRTRIQGIMSRLLYQLSYGPMRYGNTGLTAASTS